MTPNDEQFLIGFAAALDARRLTDNGIDGRTFQYVEWDLTIPPDLEWFTILDPVKEGLNFTKEENSTPWVIIKAEVIARVQSIILASRPTVVEVRSENLFCRVLWTEKTFGFDVFMYDDMGALLHFDGVALGNSVRPRDRSYPLLRHLITHQPGLLGELPRPYQADLRREFKPLGTEFNFFD